MFTFCSLLSEPLVRKWKEKKNVFIVLYSQSVEVCRVERVVWSPALTTPTPTPITVAVPGFWRLPRAWPSLWVRLICLSQSLSTWLLNFLLFHLSVKLLLCLSEYLFVFLLFCLCIPLPFCLFVFQSVCLLSVCLSALFSWLSVSLLVCLSAFLFVGLSVPSRILAKPLCLPLTMLYLLCSGKISRIVLG